MIYNVVASCQVLPSSRFSPVLQSLPISEPKLEMVNAFGVGPGDQRRLQERQEQQQQLEMSLLRRQVSQNRKLSTTNTSNGDFIDAAAIRHHSLAELLESAGLIIVAKSFFDLNKN